MHIQLLLKTRKQLYLNFQDLLIPKSSEMHFLDSIGVVTRKIESGPMKDGQGDSNGALSAYKCRCGQKRAFRESELVQFAEHYFL